jgi:hypothetical protein
MQTTTRGVTLGQLQQGRKREVKILAFGPIRRQSIRNYGTKENILEWKERRRRATVTEYVSQGVAAETGHGKVVT